MTYQAKRILSFEEAKGLVNTEVPTAEPTDIAYDEVVVDADTGLPLMVVTRYQGDLGQYRRAVRNVRFGKNARAGGMKNVNTNFGFTARVPVLRRMACSVCTFAHQQPEEHAVVEQAADMMWHQFEQLIPDRADFTKDVASGVLPDWRLANTPWTSGVLNETSALYYHFDRNNFAGSWSAMITVRRDARGGHLHFPEYDLTLACRDGDVMYFSGSQLLHGVTPIARNADGYRISAVYYSIAKMRKCLPVEEELKHAQAQRTAQAENLMDRQRKGGLI
jgi:hypothetical protein